MAVMTAAADVALPAHEAAGTTFAWRDLTVVVTRTKAQVDEAWQTLQACRTAPMFQGRAFLGAWQRTAAQRCGGESPVYVVGTRDGVPMMLLPMALTRKLGARLLTWSGQTHANYGMGLFHPELLAAFAEGDADIDALIVQIGRAAGADIVHLKSQPARWAGAVNPFATSMRALQSANDTFVLRLEDDFQAQYKRLFSKRTLSNLKRKARKLEDLGKVAFVRPQDTATRERDLDWFFATKTAQLAQSGRASPFAVPEVQSLYRAMARDTATFDIDTLMVGDTRVAMGLTARVDGTAYLLNSVHQGAEYARSSPGALLLHRMVAQAHAAGARIYDFGPGELPYKREWEPDVVALLNTTHLINPVHATLYAALVFEGLAKAKVKRNPLLNGFVMRLRALRARLNGRAAPIEQHPRNSTGEDKA